MAREYFLAYFDYLENWEALSDAECGRLFRAALKYSITGEAIELNGNERFLFPTIKKQIDRDTKKYEEKCVSNKGNGKYGVLGGRPKKDKIPKNPDGFSETLEKEKDKEEHKDKYVIPPESTNVLSSPNGKKSKAQKSTELKLFEKFWNAYPRKIAKQKALAAWWKIPQVEKTLEEILAGVNLWTKTDDWRKDRGQYIPYPATFLNNRRWEDEIPKGGVDRGSTYQYSATKLCTDYPE